MSEDTNLTTQTEHQAEQKDAVEQTDVSPIWCLVANLRATRPYGPGGAETRRGTQHFAPGARLYVRRTMQWLDDLPDLEVVGRHRATHRYVLMIVRGEWLERWRADLVHSPQAIRLLLPYWDGGAASKQRAEEWADYYAILSEPAGE